MNIKDYDLELLESMGVRGYSTIEAFKQLFPTNIIVTLIALIVFYIILFIFVLSFFKYVLKKRKDRRK
ncbi:MAG: ATP synthase F0 subunit B [Bacilli bacterium]|nr:ATP synthase F0 subunit B [Bacilli bacterium]